MAFDINSAKEQAPSGGFDLDSAQEDNGTPFYKKLGDEALGIWDTGAGLLHGAVHGAVNPAIALYAELQGVKDKRQLPQGLQSWLNDEFKPVSQAGERNMDAVGSFMNNIGVPIAGHLGGYNPLPAVARIPKAGKAGEIIKSGNKDYDALLASEAEVPKSTDQPVPYNAENPIPWQNRQFDLASARDAQETAQLPHESSQTPLFDQPEQGRVANPYEANIGEWRVDENGMPIRADLSMELQNLENPLQRGLWGDELGQRVNPIGQNASLADGVKQLDEQPVQGGVPLTQAIDEMPWAQKRGAINSELKGEVQASPELEAAKMEANSDYSPEATSVPGIGRMNGSWGPNSQRGALNLGDILRPKTPEQIAKKAEMRRKASAIGVKGTAYDRVNTVEEALSDIDPKKDMTRVGANTLRSGSEGALRTNQNNLQLNFTRTRFQEARNEAEMNVKRYLTDNKTGLIRKLKLLTQEERNSLAADFLELDRRQIEPNNIIAEKLGWSENQMEAARAIREALDARYSTAVDALQRQGFSPFEARPGYFPSMFSGAYSSLIGYTDKAGKWHTTGIAQADTKWGHAKAVEHYKSMGEKYADSIPMERRGMQTYAGKNRNYDGFADVVSQLAKLDPEFGKAKAIVDQHVADQVHQLYKFDVHEMKKSGVRGSLGDRPWLSRDENTKQMFEGLVNYLEQGFRYDSLQAPLNEVGQVLANPEFRSKMPNTAKFIESHVAKVEGQNLNPIGAAVNFTVDKAFETVGTGTSVPRKIVNGVTEGSTYLMMGMGNLGFAAMQLSQLPIAATIEGAAVRQVLRLPHEQLVASMGNSVVHTSALAMADAFKKPELSKLVPPHLKEAYNWAKERGMFDYSEAELVHNLNKSDARIMAEKIAGASITFSEQVTRAPMFMFMADLFNKAGFKGEDALLRAQAATDYAMVNYHGDERPGLYSSMGYAGKFLGALSTYKHNFVEQTVSRTVNVRRAPEAFIIATGIGLGLYGLGGMPGYNEANKLSELLTGKSVREQLLDDPRKANMWLDGAASYKSGVDIQSRIGMSNMLPDSPGNIAPHINNTLNILGAAADFATQQDEASLRALAYKALPGSLRNLYETKAMTDEHGWVRDAKGELKVERPRTQDETDRRATWGLKPLDERLNSETTWTQKKRNFDTDKKLRDISNRFGSAIRLGQPVNKLLQEYTDLGGDPQQLLGQIDTIMKESGKTPKERAQGELNDSLGSVRRYNEYNP